MSDNVENIIEYLRDRNNLLPYASALGFCYLNRQHFAPEYRPNFKRYFFPFRNWKRNTFYQIADITPFLKQHFTPTMIHEVTGDAPLISIVRIVVAGLTDRECDELTPMDSKEMEPLLHSYSLRMFDTDDVLNNVVGKRIRLSDAQFDLNDFSAKEWEMFDLNMQYPRNNILIFKLSIL